MAKFSEFITTLKQHDDTPRAPIDGHPAYFLERLRQFCVDELSADCRKGDVYVLADRGIYGVELIRLDVASEIPTVVENLTSINESSLVGEAVYVMQAVNGPDDGEIVSADMTPEALKVTLEAQDWSLAPGPNTPRSLLLADQLDRFIGPQMCEMDSEQFTKTSQFLRALETDSSDAVRELCQPKLTVIAQSHESDDGVRTTLRACVVGVGQSDTMEIGEVELSTREIEIPGSWEGQKVFRASLTAIESRGIRIEDLSPSYALERTMNRNSELAAHTR